VRVYQVPALTKKILVIQIPHQNTQYISVVNQHGKVIGSQGGPPKLYIKNSSSSGKSAVTLNNVNAN
jgi:hypothetical protein